MVSVCVANVDPRGKHGDHAEIGTPQSIGVRNFNIPAVQELLLGLKIADVYVWP